MGSRNFRAAASLLSLLLPAMPLFAANLSVDDVGTIISRAAAEASVRGAPATIAVVDRMGAVLGVYQMTGAPTSLPVMHNPHGADNGLSGGSLPTSLEAISKALTAAYLSSSHGNAFSTRTASQIVQDHFNPGTAYAASGPLYGVQFSQLPCSDLTVRLTALDPSTATRGPHRSPLGLAADPGGFPLYENGELVGAIGVKATGAYGYDLNIHQNDDNLDEIIALAGTIGYQPPQSIRADQITVGGLLLRYSDATNSSLRTNPLAAPAFAALPSNRGALIAVPGYAPVAALSAGSVYGSAASGYIADTSGSLSSAIAPMILVDGRQNPIYPVKAGTGAAALSQGETRSILQNALAVAILARAQIRKPAGSTAAVSVTVVDATGAVLGLASVPDAPLFGIDVALQKARTAALMSSNTVQADFAAAGLGRYGSAMESFIGSSVLSSQTAWSARAIGDISRDTYPDGINGSPNGPLGLSAALTTPFSDGLQLDLISQNLLTHISAVASGFASPDTPAYCTALPASAGSTPALPVLRNGLQIFPGGFPIYRGTQLIGGVGVSGDGVDQDDMISFLGLAYAGAQMGNGLGHAPSWLRASRFAPRGVPPRYVNCPYAPFVNASQQTPCSGL
jgi:uncharacterized protein GlcG (DUF336 family)